MDAFLFWLFMVSNIVFAAMQYNNLFEFIREKHPEELENFQGFSPGFWSYLTFGSNDHVKEKIRYYLLSIPIFFGGGVLTIGLISSIFHSLTD